MIIIDQLVLDTNQLAILRYGFGTGALFETKKSKIGGVISTLTDVMIGSQRLVSGRFVGENRRRRRVRTHCEAGGERASNMVLYDVPVSNNGARVRCLIYKKGLHDQITIKSPADIGGLSSEQFQSLNPYRKMPVLLLQDGTAFPESQVIESYILDKFRGVGPDLIPGTPELRAHAILMARIHDQYIAPIQGCLYKPMDSTEERAKQVAQLSQQLDILEQYCLGPYMCGEELSFADTSLMPTFVFMNYILPKHFGWTSIFSRRPKLERWWETLNSDPDLAKVIQEIEGGLKAWDTADRWGQKGISRQIADGTYNWTCDN